VGYPTFVASVWMTHYPTYWCHVSSGLSLSLIYSYISHAIHAIFGQA
jgi:hypothetical protein